MRPDSPQRRVRECMCGRLKEEPCQRGLNVPDKFCVFSQVTRMTRKKTKKLVEPLESQAKPSRVGRRGACEGHARFTFVTSVGCAEKTYNLYRKEVIVWRILTVSFLTLTCLNALKRKRPRLDLILKFASEGFNRGPAPNERYVNGSHFPLIMTQPMSVVTGVKCLNLSIAKLQG